MIDQPTQPIIFGDNHAALIEKVLLRIIAQRMNLRDRMQTGKLQRTEA